jgi:hypothetical protein
MVFSPISVQAALVEQTYFPSNKSAKLRVFTSIQHPFYLSNVSIGVDDIDLNVYFVESVVVDCPSNSTSSCSMIYVIHVNGSSLCSIDGQYNLNFTLQCQDSLNSTNCTLQGFKTFHFS